MKVLNFNNFRIPIRMAVLNLVHEFMHGFGKISDFKILLEKKSNI